MKNNSSVSYTSYKIYKICVPTNHFHTQKCAARILLLTGMPKRGQIDTGGTNGMGSRIGRGEKRKGKKDWVEKLLFLFSWHWPHSAHRTLCRVERYWPTRVFSEMSSQKRYMLFLARVYLEQSDVSGIHIYRNT